VNDTSRISLTVNGHRHEASPVRSTRGFHNQTLVVLSIS